MIQTLEIKNYKSIKHLQMNCKRVNVFIGEPNAGKSNIVEALGICSEEIIPYLSELTRARHLIELFFDFQINGEIEISYSQSSVNLSYDSSIHKFFLKYLDQNKKKHPHVFKFDNDFELAKIESSLHQPIDRQFKYYSFKSDIAFSNSVLSSLQHPFGNNISSLLLSNKQLRDDSLRIFRDKGFKFNLEPLSNSISISKDIEGENLYISYPYRAASETLRRILFLNLAIKSNKDSILLFDEPEANTFPFYTKYFAETIALDDTNQYFFTTHNPYLLMSLIEKTKVEDLNICITRMENYETKVYPLKPEQYGEAFDMGPDIFYNLDSFIE